MTYLVGNIPVTGAMLQALRERAGLSLREVARRSAENPNMALSATHLGRVEQEVRSVSPAVVAAYEHAVRVPLAHVIDQLLPQGRPDEAARQQFHTAVAVTVAGGAHEDQDLRLLEEAATRLEVPARIGASDVAHLEQVAALVRGLDLRYGGEVAGRLAYQPVRWAVRLREAKMTELVRRRLHVATGVLALSAGWCAFDANRHGGARALFRVALACAARADEPDLRAHVLADIAAQQNYLGFAGDALRTVRLGDGDERIGPAVQCMLHGVRGRAYAALGERDRCIREVEAAEQTAAQVEPGAAPQWLGGWEPCHVQAVCGHAYAQLAKASSLVDPVEWHKRLSGAVDELAAAGRLRAAGLCLATLTRMHTQLGNSDEADSWVDRARQLSVDLHSARVSRDLAAIRVERSGGIRPPTRTVGLPRAGTSEPGRSG